MDYLAQNALIFYENSIIRLELVSEHFGYSEEYVQEHHFLWIDRKFNQAERSRYNERYYRQQDSVNGQLAVRYYENNQIKDGRALLLPAFDKAEEIPDDVREGKASEQFVDPAIAFAAVLQNRNEAE